MGDTRIKITLAWGVKDPHFICNAKRKVILINIKVPTTDDSNIVLEEVYKQLQSSLKPEDEIPDIKDIYLINWEKV